MLNYCRVDDLLKENGRVAGVHVTDAISGATYTVKAKTVINATGVFTDTILRMDDAGSEPIIAPSQGVHLVLDKEFLPGEAAILVPHTDDGRVLFAVPWHDKIIIGTTDTPVSQPTIEPRALPAEIDFILDQIGRYLQKVPTRKDIRSIFAGLRPLVKGNSKKTAELARDHVILVAASGLITITGGKWTTYRRMAEDTVNKAIQRLGFPERNCITATLPIYDGEIGGIRTLAASNPEWEKPLHPCLPYIQAEIVWAAREELCMTVEDALSRRTRSLLLDAAAAMECAPLAASLLAAELGRDEAWQTQQIHLFRELAGNYLPDLPTPINSAI